MNKEKEIHGSDGEPPKKKLKTFWRIVGGIMDAIIVPLIVIIAIVIIVAVLGHIVLLMDFGTTKYKDELNYCQYTYGMGWIQGYTSPIGYYCRFTEEDGEKKVIPISNIERNSRKCLRQFYHPSYCG